MQAEVLPKATENLFLRSRPTTAANLSRPRGCMDEGWSERAVMPLQLAFVPCVLTAANLSRPRGCMDEGWSERAVMPLQLAFVPCVLSFSRAAACCLSSCKEEVLMNMGSLKMEGSLGCITCVPTNSIVN
ncbi:cytochrome P450 [Striga asiatica]|uniref:Cytochrome P450 n=1 Tax=Striga asiatica TaxID=4170 RepID=A0A5A7QM83_STRAF|nr:cytochrome P450 [Striga asiatica]